MKHFFNCIIQSHILHIRTIFLIIWAANKRHTDSYCNNKLFWYNLEDIGNERTKLRGRADDLAKIRVISQKFFFLWNYQNQLRAFSRIFLFLWNHTNPAEVSGGRIATKVCFLLLVVSIPLIFFRDVFYNSIGLSQVCRGQKLWYNTGKYFFVSWIFKTLGVLTIYFIDVFLNHQYSNYWIRWSNLLFFNSWILFIYVLTKRW